MKSTVGTTYTHTQTGGLGRLAAWHLPGGPVGLLARWAATSNVEVGQMKSTVGHFIIR